MTDPNPFTFQVGDEIQADCGRTGVITKRDGVDIYYRDAGGVTWRARPGELLFVSRPGEVTP